MAGPVIFEGAVIDGFSVGKRLHQGGMASIWQVTRPDLAMPALMKVPLILEGDNPAMIVGFEIEQMIMPRLTGPHVPRVIAVGDFSRPQPFIVVEQIDGETLLPVFHKAPIPFDDVVAIGTKVARALGDLHRQDVIHLDLKPSNIMLRASGEVVFIDFGLSRHLLLPDLLQEEFRVPFGTAPYIAPEQVLGVRTDLRSDIFALGVLLYHLATGQRPFGNPQKPKHFRRRLHERPIPPRVIDASLPGWFQEIVLRCIEVRPEDRYQSAAQLAFDLANPQTVTLTERSRRIEDPSRRNHLMRWFPFLRPTMPRIVEPPDRLAHVPIVLVAVDLAPEMETLAHGLRAMVRRFMISAPEARFTITNVLKTNRIAPDYMLDDEGRSTHVKRLVELRHWAGPLEAVAAGRLSFHILEAPDPADAIVHYAGQNQVDHIILGARANSALRRYLGSVSSQVVAQADCTVTVVRVPTGPAQEETAIAAQ